MYFDMTKNASIFIVGSMNMDMVMKTERMPKMGETITGSGFSLVAGGKGANQAVAVAKLGGASKIIAKVGDDIFGQSLLQSVKDYGVDVGCVFTQPGVSSGVAVITVCNGDNTIILEQGGNQFLDGSDILNCKEELSSAEAVLTQLETPFETVQSLISLLKGKVPLFLNPAPARQLPDELLEGLDYLIPNETEAAIITGMKVESVPDAIEALKYFVAKGVKHPLITLGQKGVVYFDGDSYIHAPGNVVAAVDTVAAGDTFVGALAVELTRGSSMEKAVRFAQAAAAITVTREGAQSSIPLRHEVEDKLNG